MIDRDYLAEKAVAVDKPDGIRAYSEELFRAAVKESYDAFVERCQLDADKAAALWEAVDDNVLSSADDYRDAVHAASSFQWLDCRTSGRGREVFPDFWERRLEAFTGRFVWCCYAIPWAIEQYDAIKSGQPPTGDAGATPIAEGVTASAPPSSSSKGRV